MNVRSRLFVISALCVALLAIPSLAQAKGKGSSTDRLAAQVCAQERKAIGRKAFDKKYGNGGMRACLRRSRGKVSAAIRQANQDCTQELAEVGPEEFADLYGSDETGSDAFAECVAETVDWILAPPDDSGDEGEDDEV